MQPGDGLGERDCVQTIKSVVLLGIYVPCSELLQHNKKGVKGENLRGTSQEEEDLTDRGESEKVECLLCT